VSDENTESQAKGIYIVYVNMHAYCHDFRSFIHVCNFGYLYACTCLYTFVYIFMYINSYAYIFIISQL
jgi:hypothetical protein